MSLKGHHEPSNNTPDTKPSQYTSVKINTLSTTEVLVRSNCFNVLGFSMLVLVWLIIFRTLNSGQTISWLIDLQKMCGKIMSMVTEVTQV